MLPQRMVRIVIGCDVMRYEKSMNIYFDEIQNWLNVKLTEDQYKILLHFIKKCEEKENKSES